MIGRRSFLAGIGQVLAAAAVPRGIAPDGPHSVTVELYMDKGKQGIRAHVLTRGADWRIGDYCMFTFEQAGVMMRLNGRCYGWRPIADTGWAVVRLTDVTGMVQLYDTTGS